MPVPARRRAEEVLTRLELEPNTGDIFTEGPGDAALFNWFLRQEDVHSYRVFVIEDIELPDANLPSGRPKSGNRDRVIGLSHLISGHFGDRVVPALCVADLDHELVLRSTPENPFLTFTPEASLEVLYFDEEVLDRFLDLFVRRRVAEPALLLGSLRPVLEDLFLIRVLDYELGLNAGALAPAASCILGGPNLLSFDRDDHLYRYFNRVGLAGELPTLRERLDRLRSQAGDALLVHGHDFIDLLCFVLRPFVAYKPVVEPRIARRALMTCLTRERLRAHPTFEAVLNRLS